MANLPVNDGGLRSCCLSFLAAYEGSEREGTKVRCDRCSRLISVRSSRWMWVGEDPLRPTERKRSYGNVFSFGGFTSGGGCPV